MNGWPLLSSGLPEMPLFLPVSLVTMWMKSWEERCTHIREAGATKTFHFQINLALSLSSIWVVLMCLKSGGSALLESKKGAKIRRKKLLYGIRTIRSYSEAPIEEQGKLSLCYEKNISQDITCRKAFVIACTEKVLSGFRQSKICHSV